MPFKSDKQRKLMFAVAEGRTKRKDAPPIEVAREYIAEERRRKAQTTNEQN